MMWFAGAAKSKIHIILIINVSFTNIKCFLIPFQDVDLVVSII